MVNVDRIVYFRSQETGGLISLLESEVETSLEEEIENRNNNNGDLPVSRPTPVMNGYTVTARCFRAGYWPPLPVDYEVVHEEILCSTPSFDDAGRSPYTLDGEGISQFPSTDVLVMGYSYYLVEECLVHSHWVIELAVNDGDGLVVQDHPIWQLPEGWQSPCHLRQTPRRNLRDSLYPYTTDVVEFFQCQLEAQTLYLGLEWEAKLSSGTKIPDLLNWFDQLIQNKEAIPTRDGTVDFELKISPMKPSSLKSFLHRQKSWFESLVYGKDVGAHLHVSRSSFFNELAQAYFVVSVTEDAGRDYDNLFGPESSFAKVKYKTLANWKSMERKEAVNTLKPHTIEIRAFRGTGDVSLHIARIEYVVEKVNEANRFALMR